MRIEYNDAYRLRVGNYRVGFFINDDTLLFSRALHRREIYRYFP
jgi:mRNA interferase RelE/StbE